MTYLERTELNRLSKEVFGTSSRWKKITENGVAEPHERDREVILPKGNSFVKKVFTDKKDIVRRYSVQEVKKLMEDILESRKKITIVDTNNDTKKVFYTDSENKVTIGE